MKRKREPREALDPQQKQILSVLFLGVLMAALDVAIVGPALPSIGRSFGVDTRSLAWVFTTYVLFTLIGSPLTARLSDLYGRRTIYAADVAVFAAGSLLVAGSTSFPMLLAGRAVQGFGAGGILPVASAVIGDVFPLERRGRALGLLGMVFGVAFLIGPVLGGIFLRFGWHWLFLINLPIAAAVILRGLRLLPAGHRGEPGRIDLPGVLLLSGGLALLALGISAVDAQRLAESLGSLRVWPRLGAAAVLLALFWRLEQRTAKPLIAPALLRQSQLRIANLLSGMAGMIEAGFVFMPSLIVAAFGVAPHTASFLLLPAVLAVAAGAPVTGQMLDRHGSRSVVVLGAGVLSLGLFLLRWETAALPLFIGGAVVIGLGLSSLIGAPLRYIVLNAAAPEYRAAAQAVSTLFRSVGHMVGGPLAGALIASHPGGLAGYHLTYTVLAAIVALGALLALDLKPREAERLTAV